MSVRPVDFNGMIQRTNDVSQMKTQEDQKPMVDQQMIQHQVSAREQQILHQVVQSNESSQMDNHADAREEGKGKYYKNESSRKKQKSDSAERVINRQSSGGFDIRV